MYCSRNIKETIIGGKSRHIKFIQKVYLLRQGVIDSILFKVCFTLQLAVELQVQKEIGYVSFSDISSCD